MEKLLPDTNSSEANSVVPVLDKLIQFSLFTFAAFSMFSISITQISFAIGAIAWLIKIQLTKSWEELRGTWVGIAIFCFCLACFLAVITAVDWESSIEHLKKLIQFVIFFWVANTVQDEKQRNLIVTFLVIAGVVASLNGLYPQLEARNWSPIWSPRSRGTMSTATTFSGLLMLASLMTLGSFLYHKPKKYWLLVSFGIIFIGILYTQSRQAWVGELIGILFLVFFWKKNYLLLIPLLLVGLLLYAPTSISNRMLSFTNLQDSSLQQRVSTWKVGWEIFKDHPLTGCGFKCVDFIHSQYPDPSGYTARYRGLHNNILQLLVDTGIVGLGLWISIWVAYFIKIFKRRRSLAEETVQDSAMGILMGSSAVVLGFLVCGTFETNIYDSEVAMLLYFLMGLSLAQVKKAPKAE